MREILFRGRKKNGTEWFEGDLSYLVHDRRECYIFSSDGYNSPDYYEVAPETVGQYTGLTDKNSKKVFEGDIVVSGFGRLSVIKIGRYRSNSMELLLKRYKIKKFYEYGIYAETPNGKQLEVDGRGNFEVIGNIYDNPELLRKAK